MRPRRLARCAPPAALSLLHPARSDEGKDILMVARTDARQGAHASTASRLLCRIFRVHSFTVRIRCRSGDGRGILIVARTDAR